MSNGNGDVDGGISANNVVIHTSLYRPRSHRDLKFVGQMRPNGKPKAEGHKSNVVAYRQLCADGWGRYR